jgi:ABC-2 type transport system ATP-binding protein
MVLETDHLTKDYGRFRALDDLTLQVREGEIFGLLGPNGSGKSTTIRLLLGFLRPTAGRAAIAGHDCWRDSVAVRSKVAYLPGELRLYENMTGRQLLRFLCKLHGQRFDEQTEHLARRFELDLSRPIASLSSGMKRKLALVQVLVPRVPLVILDEPTNTLDPVMRDELLEQLRQAKAAGKTVLFSSHVLAEVERVCDRIGILCRGRLVHLQAMSELRQIRCAHVRFAPGSTPASVPDLAGIRLREQHDGSMTFTCEGNLDPLLAWLAQYRVADLRIEPIGLTTVYQRYHGTPS